EYDVAGRAGDEIPGFGGGVGVGGVDGHWGGGSCAGPMVRCEGAGDDVRHGGGRDPAEQGVQASDGLPVGDGVLLVEAEVLAPAAEESSPVGYGDDRAGGPRHEVLVFEAGDDAVD